MSDEDGSELRFIADEMLGKLAKWLRTIGYDTVYYTGGGDGALVQRALAEGRILLTKDSHLIRRKLARKALFIESDQPQEQLKQVVENLQLDTQSKLFSRCLMCNQELASVRKESIQDKVPVYTYLTQDRFYKCPDCGRIYWPGTHKDSMLQVLGDIHNH
jgi:uncharacterized protein with PIN domain